MATLYRWFHALHPFAQIGVVGVLGFGLGVGVFVVFALAMLAMLT